MYKNNNTCISIKIKYGLRGCGKSLALYSSCVVFQLNITGYLTKQFRNKFN